MVPPTLNLRLYGEQEQRSSFMPGSYFPRWASSSPTWSFPAGRSYISKDARDGVVSEVAAAGGTDPGSDVRSRQSEHFWIDTTTPRRVIMLGRA